MNDERDDRLFFEDTALYREHMSAARLPYPERIQFEVTSECNLRCIMCPITSESDRGRSGESLRYSLEACLELRELFEAASTVELTGFGEIFTHPQIIEILRFLKSCRLDVHGSSNAIALKPEMSRIIVAEKLMDVLCFSIDAASAPTYRRIRRGATWKELHRNLGALREAKQELSAKLPLIYFSFVAMRRNIEELPDFVRMASDYGACKVIVQHVVENRLTVGQSLINFPDLANRCREQAAQVADELRIELDMRNLNPVETGEANPVKLGKLWTPQNFKEANQLIKNCEFPWKHIFLKSNQDVQICAILWEQMVMGNLRETSIDNIWNGKKYRELRDQMACTDSPEACVFCLFRGWRKPTPLDELHSEIKMGPQHEGQLGLGWHDPEHDKAGRPFRWMSGPATMFLRNAGGPMIELELYRYEAAPLLRGNLLINDINVGPIDSHDVYGDTVRVPVPPGLGPVLKIEIAISKPWHSQEADGLEGNRYLGFLAFGAANVGDIDQLSSRLKMDGSESEQLGVGWLPHEGHGRDSFRWIGGHALVVMPENGRKFVLSASLPKGLDRRMLQIFCGSEKIYSGLLEDNGRQQTIKADLPQSEGWRIIRLEVAIPDGNGDRPYGLRIHGMSVEG
ncbi:MAG: radical SAM protein [Candidatus Alcyoniella australis]|nr:radical SAM protein [Candidatus Alcyoniella australis]